MTDRAQPHGKPILSLDFDGVIHSYISGWKGITVITDPPVPGVFVWIRKAYLVFDIHVYSSRSYSPECRIAMFKSMLDNDEAAGQIVFFTKEKPHTFISIDDRCKRFDGDWFDPSFDPQELLKFVPWYKGGIREPRSV